MPRRRVSQAERVASAAAAGATKAALASQPADDQVDIEIDDNEESELEADALASLAQLAGDAGEPVHFTLRCIQPSDKRGTIEDDLSKDDLPDLVATIRDNYGPGTYLVQALGPTGQFIKNGRRRIKISPLTSRRPGALPAPAPPVSAPNGTFEQWLQRQEVLEERRRQERREDQKFYLELLAPLLPTLLGNRESVASIMAAAKDATALAGGGGGASAEKALEALLTGIKLGKEFNGGASDSWPTVVRDTIQALTGSPPGQAVLDRIAGRGPAAGVPPAGPRGALPGPTVPYKPAAAPGAAVQPVGAIPVPARPAPQGFPEPVWLQVVLPLLTRLSSDLLEYAQNGADPGLAAEALVGKIPRTVRGMVKSEQAIAWLTDPNWWTLLKDFRPELEPYQGYCDDVRQVLHKLMTEPEHEPEQP